jgi:aerobic carbon-monoxide dehydrogenase medium subunit
MLIVHAIAYDGIAASRGRIPPFRLFRPNSVAAVCELLAEWPDAVLHAGGIDLVSRMKAGRPVPTVIALRGVSELRGVRHCDDELEIGAATSHWEIEHDEVVRAVLPCLAAYVEGLGNVRVRAQGTVGGNIMAGERGYELMAILAALDAKLCFVARDDGRRFVVPVRELSSTTDLPNDLLTTISIQLPPRAVAWNRDLRPMLGTVAAFSGEGGTVRSGYGATSGLGLIGGPLTITRPISLGDLENTAAALAEDWAASVALSANRLTVDPGYLRHVLGVQIRRLIAGLIRDMQ